MIIKYYEVSLESIVNNLKINLKNTKSYYCHSFWLNIKEKIY
jgi:hypothetical protein